MITEEAEKEEDSIVLSTQGARGAGGWQSPWRPSRSRLPTCLLLAQGVDRCAANAPTPS